MANAPELVLPKCQTGISGLDQISGGGLPRGRPTLVAGHAGSGKTLFAMEFVLNGIELYDDPGVFVSFEETPDELAVNVASLGYDIGRHVQSGQLRVVHIELAPEDLIESGEFNLDGLFMRLGAAIDAVGARRIALDAVENLFASFADLRILRSEFRRLMNWIKARGITAVVTTERGTDSISRHGLEEYIADCVLTLDNRVEDQISTRRLRIVKYRGSAHVCDECPFVLDHDGFSVIPVAAASLSYPASVEHVSTGIESLDSMLSGGIFRGSSLLVSGSAGTGKSSIAAQMADAACRRGERCLYVALEESPDQIERNMTSIGFDLAARRRAGLLRFHAVRPTSSGLEVHLATVATLMNDFKPGFVVIDPVTSFKAGSVAEDIKLMLIRAVDLFKSFGVTSLFTALTTGEQAIETSTVGISSLMDVWLLLRNHEQSGERTRALYVCKARGMSHSNQVREFLLGESGVKLVEVLLDDTGEIVTGSARQLRQRLKEAEALGRMAEDQRRRAALESRRTVLESKIKAMRAEYDEELRVLEIAMKQEDARIRSTDEAVADIASLRSHPEPAAE
jgi:circadian clock protein KaiC